MLGSVAAVSGRDVWLAGRRSNPLYPGVYIELQHFDGHTLTEMGHPRIGSYWDLYDPNLSNDKLSFDSPDDGWLVSSYMMNEEVWLDNAAGSGQFPRHPLAEHWNGKRWILTPVQVQPDVTFGSADVTSVLALSPADAWLVGSVTPPGQGPKAMIQHWDGQRWQIIPQPGAGLAASALYSVAGTSADDVWAVGGYVAADGSSPALVEHWDGHA